MLLGYARVSTEDQDLSVQLAALKKAGCERIFREKLSGATRARPELEKLLDSLRPRDVLLVTRLDRLARSTRDLLGITEQIVRAQAGLRSIAEPWADSTSPAGKMILTFFAGIAEFERSLIAERTRSGRVHAKSKGVRFGRKPKLTADQVTHAKELQEAGKSIRAIAAILGVHHSTVYRSLCA